MVQKFFNFFYRELAGLHEAALLLACSALASQILALLRDRLLAASFGAGPELDIYYTAFRVPDILYVTIASFVSVTVLIPFLIARTAKDQVAAKIFLNQVFSIFVVVMIVCLGIIFFLAPIIAPVIAPGFTSLAQAKLVVLLRILLLSPLFLGLSNLFGSVTQSLRHFFVYALSPVVYNLGIIVGIIFFYPHFGLAGLAWGVVLGALVHAGIQLPVLARTHWLPRFTLTFNWRELKQVIFISLPRTLTLATHQLALLVFAALASLMTTGSVAIFNLSFNLQSVPLAIIGVSYSVAAFPTLAKSFSDQAIKTFLSHMEVAIKHIIFWSLPATVFFIVLRAQIVRTILGAGAFDWQDTRITAAALALFALSVAAQSLTLLFIRSYYAAGQTKTPLVANLASYAIILILAWALMYCFDQVVMFRYFLESLLRVADVPGTRVLVLPLAFSLGVIINATIHWIWFERDFAPLSRQVMASFWQSFSAAILGGFAAYLSLGLLATWLSMNTFWGIFSQGLIAGLVGILVWLVILWAQKSQELVEISRALHHKFWRSQVLVPEPKEL